MGNTLLSPFTIRLAIVLATTGLLGFAYYLQFVEGLEPCPLCVTQRFFFLCGGLLALSALLQRPQLLGQRLYSAGGVVLACTGGYFSSRQLYLQSLPPDQVPACGPSLDFILQTFPLMEALSIMMRGNGNCAEVVWTLLGLSIPAWSLIAFAGLAACWLVHGFVANTATSTRE